MLHATLYKIAHAAALASMFLMPWTATAQIMTSPPVADSDGSARRPQSDTGADLDSGAGTIDLVIFRPDREYCTPGFQFLVRDGGSVVAFTDEGEAQVLASETKSVATLLDGTDENSSYFALLAQAEYTGVYAILEQEKGKDRARLTYVDADGNIMLRGTILSHALDCRSKGEAQMAKISPLVPLAIVLYVWNRTWCISRCDRCTDTCNGGNCDNNACDDCFSAACD